VDNTTDAIGPACKCRWFPGSDLVISELYAPRYIQRALRNYRRSRPCGRNCMKGRWRLRRCQSRAWLGVDEWRFQQERTATGGRSRVSGEEGCPMAAPPPRRRDEFHCARRHRNRTGRVIRIRIAQPVTIKKNESAMLPFLQDKVKARKVDLYSDMDSLHP